MRLNEIFTPDEPIVLELVLQRLKAGDIVALYWTEFGRDNEAYVYQVRHARSGDGYAIDYVFSDHRYGEDPVGDTIFYRSKELENAKFWKDKVDNFLWHLDLRKTDNEAL